LATVDGVHVCSVAGEDEGARWCRMSECRGDALFDWKGVSVYPL
jgi:hypothetical protein